MGVRVYVYVDNLNGNLKGRTDISWGDCHLVSGGFMSAMQAAADNTSRAPDCIVEFDMDWVTLSFRLLVSCLCIFVVEKSQT